MNKSTFVIVLIILFLAWACAYAAEPENEMIMETDVGEVVLTVDPCTLQVYLRFIGMPYYAYATEVGQPIHPGCWDVIGSTVHIHFPELGDTMATYDKNLFHPRPHL